jgi:uncharacterized membrane protein YphA (DoxX/SURF4 family)
MADGKNDDASVVSAPPSRPGRESYAGPVQQRRVTNAGLETRAKAFSDRMGSRGPGKCVLNQADRAVSVNQRNGNRSRPGWQRVHPRLDHARQTQYRCIFRRNGVMNSATRALQRSSLAIGDLDYHVIRGSMVIIFLFFGYQKWFAYESQVLIPFISNGPFIFWLYPVFGVRGATWFLGGSEWLICALLLCGFWDKRLGVLGAAGSTATFIASPSFRSCLTAGRR